MNTESLMEYLIINQAPNLPPEALAEVFDRLIWCLADNGEEIGIVQKRWLEGDSFEKCAIALAMEEVFPYEKPEKMSSVFKDIVTKWPQLEAQCLKNN